MRVLLFDCTFIISIFGRHFVNEIANPKFKAYKLEMVAKIEQYLMTSGCRRLSVLSHFDSEIEKSGKKIGGTKECCDNCRTR